MRFTKLVILCALAAAPVVLATPCTTGTLDTYIALGSTGCMDSIFNVEDFTFEVISTAGMPITANDITVIPSTLSLQFSFSSTVFNVSGANSIQVQIGYLWDPGDVGGISGAMDDHSPVFPGEASVTIHACENANFFPSGCPTTLATLQLFDNGQGVPMLNATVLFPPGVTSLGILDTIDLVGNGSTSNIDSYSETILTPEPATLLLVPTAAGVLFAWRRRTRTHSGQPFL